MIGFSLDGNSTVWVDKFKVSYLGNPGKADNVAISEETFIAETPKNEKQLFSNF